jgi:hypothetical protein
MNLLRPSAIGAAFLLSSVGLFAQAGWQELDRRPGQSVWASSTLEETLGGRIVRYAAENLFDGDLRTCWAEGVQGDGIGQSVTFVVDRPVESLRIVSGYAASERLFRRNGRPKVLRVSLLAGFTAPGLVSETDAELYFVRSVGGARVFEMADTMRPQVLDAPVGAEGQARAVREALERFLTEFPDFARMMGADLGFDDPASLRGGARDEFLELAQAAFGMIGLRLEIAGVYPGSHYSDTCLSEITVRF